MTERQITRHTQENILVDKVKGGKFMEIPCITNTKDNMVLAKKGERARILRKAKERFQKSATQKSRIKNKFLNC